MRAMGVRFVVPDLAIAEYRARTTHVRPLEGGIDLRLYELARPNVAGFSPVKLSPQVSPLELVRRIRSDPALLESEAFVDADAVRTLVPIQRSQIMFEKGAVHVH